jgi:hypothetical protein
MISQHLPGHDPFILSEVCTEEVEDKRRWFGNAPRLFTHEIEQSDGVGLAETRIVNNGVNDRG